MSTFKLSTYAEDVALELDSSTPVLMAGNTDLNSTFQSDSGVTVNIRKTDFGADLVAGADATSSDGSIIQNIVPVTLLAQNSRMTVSQLEQDYSAGKGEQTVKNRVQYIGSQIQKKAINALALGAGIAVIQNTADSASYKDLRRCIASVKKSRATSEIVAGMDPIQASQVRDSGVSFFQADLSGSFGDGSMGKLDGVKAFEHADFGTLTVGTRVLTGALTVTSTLNVDSTSGATTSNLAYTAATSLVGTVKAGEIIYATGIKGVDVFKQATNVPFAFIVQSDYTAAGATGTLVVQPVVFTARDPNKNVGALSIPAGTVLTLGFGANAGATYNRGLVWSKPAFEYVNRPMADVDGWENMNVTTLKGLSFLATKGGNFDTGANSVVWRILTGFAISYPELVAVYYSLAS